MPNPFKNIINVKRSELPLALLMFSYFFLVITSFWILKPIKKWLFIGFYDQQGFDLFNWHLSASQAELLAKVLNMLVALLAVTVFTLLARRFRREQLTFIFSLFFISSYIFYALILDQPSHLVVWSFYLFGDLFSTLMVATFFSFLNDSVVPSAAKRLYGLIGLGGVLGGVFGASFVSIRIKQAMEAAGAGEAISFIYWMWICLGIALLIMAIAYAAGLVVRRNPPEIPKKPAVTIKKSGGNAALEGARLVFQSRYLLAIVGIVGLYEIVSTVVDFQFTSTIAHYLDGAAIGQQFSLMFTITNWVSLFVQLFLTSYIMTRFGLTIALLVLPLAAAFGSMAFMAVPVLWVGSFLNTADNGFAYSINQSAKETLYTPTSRDEKYKAKAFIDMFVQRFAKAIAVGISLLVTTLFTDFSSIRWLSLFTLCVALLWIMAVRYAGRKFREMESSA
ncbi:MFS transporter [bacterium]|nr:MFS transporter [bacterium]MBU1650894.1 MFS transporter [bacterium]